jgi:hypothetical protein
VTRSVPRGFGGLGEEVPAPGVIFRVKLVASGPGTASGTFTATGAVAGSGTVTTDPIVPPLTGEGSPVRMGGAVRMRSSAGDVVIEIVTMLRSVPETGVFAGGGAWTLAAASGIHDGLRAAGSVTIVAEHDDAGSATIEMTLVGRVVGATRRLPAKW